MSLVTINDTNLKDIANAIREKNRTADTYTPNEMASAISNIESGINPSGELNIVENGTYNVTNYATANVNVEVEVPTGTLNIGVNGVYDVTEYASVNVNVEGSGGSKYAPRYISFSGYKGTELNYELENLDGSNLTSMLEMFFECKSLVSLTTTFDVPNVTSMLRLCSTDTNLQTVDFSSFGTSAVTNCSYMLNQCDNLTSVDLSNFVTPNLTNCGYMFNLSSKLTTIKLGKLDTSNVTSMKYMFRGVACTELDLSNFNTSKVTDMSNMFYQCSKLTKLDIRNFDFTNVKTYSNVFASVPTNCLIIVKDDTAKAWVKARNSNLTNVKTVAEL